MADASSPAPPDARRLGFASITAVGVAAVVLLAAVLPAEYGVDPTGLGALTGFSRLSEETSEPAVVPDPPAGPNETYAFDARFVVVEEQIGEWSGRQTTRDIQGDVRFPLSVPNLTRVVARLAWTDDAPSTGPDTFEVSVRAPGRNSDLAQSDSGHVQAVLAWRSIPFPSPTDDGGLRLEATQDNSSFGDWRVIVRLYGTGPTPEAPDDGNDWTLTLTAERYELATTSLEGAADRVALTLRPRGQVEYKFEMDANATMSYRWNASGPVYFDLHADLFEDPDDFTSAKIATLAQDAGTYTAPYHGRHGWYWRNDGATDVTIHLETRGDYRILGVVG